MNTDTVSLVSGFFGDSFNRHRSAFENDLNRFVRICRNQINLVIGNRKVSRRIDGCRNESGINGNHSRTKEFIKITLGEIIFANKILKAKTVSTRGVDFHQRTKRTNCINGSATVCRRNFLNKVSPVVGGVAVSNITSAHHVARDRSHSSNNFQEDICFERTASTETEVTPIEHTSCDCIPVNSRCDFDRRGVNRNFVIEDGLQYTTVYTFCDFVDFEEFVRTDNETTSVAPTDLTNFSKESRIIRTGNRRSDRIDYFSDNSFEVATNGFVFRDLRILHASKAFLLEFSFETGAFKRVFNDCFVLESEVVFRGLRFCFIMSLSTFNDRVDDCVEIVVLTIKIEMFHHCCSPPLIKVQRLRKDRVCHWPTGHS